MKKKLSVFASVAVAAVMCVCACGLVGCGRNEEAVSFVSLDINPSVELTLDGRNKVVSVRGVNEDGKVLLYGETDIVGMDVDSAVEKITKLAEQLKYLNENNKTVRATVTSAKAGAEELMNKVNASITAAAGDFGFTVESDGESAYSLLRKLESIKARYPDSEAIKALTPQKLKIVLSAVETGEISLEAAAEMNESELIKFVGEAYKKAENFATDAYEQAKSAASAIYDEAVGTVIDGIYATYCRIHSPKNTGYGLMYQGYKTAARSLNAVCKALVYVEKAADYPLDENQTAIVAEALGLADNVEVLKNSDGEVTVNSIYAYVDKLFKNSDAAGRIQAVKEKIDVALDSVESQLQTEIDELSLKYKEEIEAAKEAFDTITESVKEAAKLVPDYIKEQLNAMVSDGAEISATMLEILCDGKITSDEVRSLADKLNEKAAVTAEKIEKDLSKKEIEQVRNLQEKALEGLTSAKKAMSDALGKAEKEARARLEELKAARRA